MLMQVTLIKCTGSQINIQGVKIGRTFNGKNGFGGGEENK